MRTRINLTIDETVLAQAVERARGLGLSLSRMVENALKVGANESRHSGVEIRLAKFRKHHFHANYKEPSDNDIAAMRDERVRKRR